MQTEFECRFINVDAGDMRTRLADAGFKLIQPVHLMRRKIFTLPDTDGMHRWLRLRDQCEGPTLALKLKGKSTSVSAMQEIEVIIGDFTLMGELLESAGLECSAYEENRREKWEKGMVEVCIDTWPGLEPFAEIEADCEDAVRSAAAELGFDWNNAMFGNVTEVYEKKGISLDDIHKSCTFAHPPQAKTS